MNEVTKNSPISSKMNDAVIKSVYNHNTCRIIKDNNYLNKEQQTIEHYFWKIIKINAAYYQQTNNILIKQKNKSFYEN